MQVDAEVFSSYECRSLPADLGKPHPGDISEPGLLAAVSLPPPTYGSEAFDGEAIDDAKLSRLQLEGVRRRTKSSSTAVVGVPLFWGGVSSGYFSAISGPRIAQYSGLLDSGVALPYR